MDGVPPDPDPLDVGVVLEKLVCSRLVGGVGVLCVPIGVNLVLLECLAVHEKVGELISLADKNARVESAQKITKICENFKIGLGHQLS